MKKVVLFSAMSTLACFATVAGAQEVGRVLSSTPVVQQVAVPRQVCNQQAMPQQSSNGGGAVLGAIVGGLLGNTMGHGMGRAAATGAGVVAGAAIGDNLQVRGQPQAMQQCSTQTFYENRTVGYNVVYEYAGKQSSVQLPYDPGQTIRLQMTPVGAAAMAPSGPGPSQSVIVAPPVDQGSAQSAPESGSPNSGQAVATIIGSPGQTGYAGAAYPVAVYPGYYAPAYYAPAYYAPYYRSPYFYPPIGLSLSFGYSRGWGGGHGHWR